MPRYITSFRVNECKVCLSSLSEATRGVIRAFKQTQRRRQRERLKMQLRVSAIISKLFKVISLAKSALTILELNWSQRFSGKKTKLNIYHYKLVPSTQLQNRSFHVVERTRTSAKCPKMENTRAKRAKLLFFIVKVCKFVTFLLPSP